MFQIKRTPLRLLSILWIVSLLASAGCAEQIGDINKTQPNMVAKSQFQGVWYMVRTVTEVPYGVSFSFVGEMSFGANPKIIWEVQEDYLIVYPVTETLEGAEKGYHTKKIRRYWDSEAQRDDDPSNDFAELFVGQPLAAYPIEKHFDVQRKYNQQTGEQSNVIEENSSDRPWYQRDYMRVDWSSDAISDFQFAVGRLPTTSVPYYVQDVEDANHPDRPEFEDGYIGVVIKFFAQPQSTGYCSVYTLATGDCSGGVVKARYSYKRVDTIPTYNARIWHNSYEQDKFGFFQSERYTFAEETGLTYSGQDMKINRWNLWRQVWDFEDIEDASTCRVDDDCGSEAATFCYQENWFEVGADGKDLGICKRRTLRGPWARYRSNADGTAAPDGVGIKPIIYHLSPDFPEHLMEETYDMADGWNDVFREALSWMLFWDEKDAETGGMFLTRFCDKDADCSADVATTEVDVNLTSNGRTALIYQDGDSIKSLITSDGNKPANVSGKALARFVNLTPGSGNVSFRTGSGDVLADVSFDANEAYADYLVLDPAKFSVEAHDASGKLGELTNVNIEANGIYMFIFVNGTVVKAQSSLLSGVDGLAGDTGLRIVNLLTDHGPQNVVVNGSRRGEGLAFGENTGFLNAGYMGTHKVILVGTSRRQDLTCFHKVDIGRCVGSMPELTEDDYARREEIKGQLPPAYVLCRNQFTGTQCDGNDLDDCRYTWSDSDSNEHNACRDDVWSADARKKIGDARYNLVYYIHEAQSSSPLGYGPSAADPDTGEIYFAAANIYGAPLTTYSQYAKDLIDLVHGDGDVADTVSGKYIRDFLGDLTNDDTGTHHAGLDHAGHNHSHGMKRTMAKLPSSTEAMRALADNQRLQPMRMMTPVDAPELWRFHRDEDFRNQLLSEVLGGFPTQEQLEARFAKIKGTPYEQMMINNEVKVGMSGGQLEPGEALNAEMLKKLSPVSWSTQSAVNAERERMRLLTSTANNTCIFLPDFIDDAIYGLAKSLKEDQGLSGDALRDALERHIYGGVIEHEVGHTIGLRHNFAGSNDLFNFKDEYYDIREKEVVKCQNDNWCEQPGAGETCVFVSCSTDADCGDGLECDTDESTCVDVVEKTRTGYCNGPQVFSVDCGSCPAGTECDASTNLCAQTASCSALSDCGEGETCDNGFCSKGGSKVYTAYTETLVAPVKKLAPRPYMTERERDNRRTEYQYTTVMDYGGRFNSDIHGLGKYDYAAVKAGYGDLVEVYNDTSGFDAYVENAANYYNYPPNTFAYVKDTSWFRYSGTTGSPFGILENYIGIEQNKKRVTVPWDQVRYEHDMVTNYLRDELDYTYIEVPYRACYDEYRGNLGCYYFDTGVDIGEMVYHSMGSLQYYYLFDAFKRERYSFGQYGSASSYFSRILDRYMTQLGHGGQYYALYYHIFKDYLWFANWKDAPYDGRVLRTTSEISLQYLTDLLATPAPGSYRYNADRGLYENISFEVAHPESELDVPVGQGKFPYTRFMSDGGYYDFKHALWIGSFWEKMAALLTLTDSTAYFTSDFVSELGVMGATSIGFNTLYQVELTNILGGIVSGDLDRYAGVSDGVGFQPRPVFASGDENLLNGTTVEPSISDFTFKLYAAVYGLSYLPAGFDPTFTDAMAIVYDGNGSQYDLTNVVDQVNFEDPFGGKTYVAFTSNYVFQADGTDEARAPFQVGYTMLTKANELKTAWENATDETEKLSYEAQIKEMVEILEILRGLNELYGTMGY